MLPMQGFGIEVDAARNEAMVGGRAGEIQTEGSAVRVLVIPTDEELSIAKQTLQVVGAL
jgi:acetate kinase